MWGTSRGSTRPSVAQPPNKSLFVLHYKSRHVLTAFPTGYDQLQDTIRRYFPDIPADHRVSYHTDELAVSNGALVEVFKDIWETVIPFLNSLTVRSEPTAESADRRVPWGPSEHAADALDALNDRWCETDFIYHTIQAQSQAFHPWTDGSDRGPSGTSGSGTSGPLRIGKPVIYLLPPAGTEIDATVKLSLVPEWRLSVIYPVVPVDSSFSEGQKMQWDVRASSDGTLLEKTTGLTVAYLFWEAEAPVGLSARDGGPSLISDETFIPSKPQLGPMNSVVLEVANMTPYLDSALKALGLHTEARTSFITYWLPSFLKHTHIALRFLPQHSYEHPAPLEVTPTPDMVVRVFMLLKGLKSEDVRTGDASGWSNAMGDISVDHWRKVVGVDEDRSLADDELFRVVEWGGMEVLS